MSDPGTPCGEYLRRYWQPVAMAEELGALPMVVRVLGEDLVLFRDGSGRPGLLHRHCAHRGASLEYGIVAERGIICCYHGWHYDVDGTILRAGSEPPDSPVCRNVVQGAYPVHEHHGLLFAWLGPPEERPSFPVFDSERMPDASRRPVRSDHALQLAADLREHPGPHPRAPPARPFQRRAVRGGVRHRPGDRVPGTPRSA